MRYLTQEEKDLAPNWATHYWIEADDGDILFESDNYFVWLVRGTLLATCNMGRMSISEAAKPIHCKPFDISEHVFSDRDFNILQEGDNVLIEIDCDRSLFGKLNKADAIAIAKALGVVGSDL